MKKPALLQHKWFLYATEFFSGMSVMAVELGASRLLSPYFSSSQIVWTIIIGTIMIAMALGNIIGGRLADKDPNPDKLYLRILIAAVWTALIPLVGKYIIVGITLALASFVNANFLVWASFASCMILFVFPLLMLGTVTPSLAKFTVDSLDDSGKTVGMLGALNTVGSIIGTFLPTFVTIPAVGTALTFLIFAGILLLLCLIYFGTLRKKLVACLIASLLFVLSCIFGSRGSLAFWESGIIYEDESIYNYLQVKEDSRQLSLSTNVMFGVQSVMMKGGGLTGMYYDYALGAPVLAGISEEDACDMLILGMGTGTYAKMCQGYFPKAEIEGVEIDQKITDLAYQVFELPESVKITTFDGRAYLDMTDKKYDVIMVDAYKDITFPFQMSTVEFFTKVRERLKENGVMVVNMNLYSETANSINDYLADTIASVFPRVYSSPVGYTGNVELFACLNKDAAENIGRLGPDMQSADLTTALSRISSQLSVYEDGGLRFTDDKAPVEMLG
ncbi:MAG: fused MFS/spermidine synthase, partial [Lachnospiraceae bacterium]|nr:fused MFS/spermidine synthase [Lachnospiraceae bacterium]